MKRYVWLVILMIFCMISQGLNCKRTQEEHKGRIEGNTQNSTVESFEDEVNEEVGKIPSPAEEWGGVAEEPLGE